MSDYPPSVSSRNRGRPRHPYLCLLARSARHRRRCACRRGPLPSGETTLVSSPQQRVRNMSSKQAHKQNRVVVTSDADDVQLMAYVSAGVLVA
jgi:hypothetical protein